MRTVDVDKEAEETVLSSRDAQEDDPPSPAKKSRRSVKARTGLDLDDARDSGVTGTGDPTSGRKARRRKSAIVIEISD